jgi:hypothetical protein
VKGRRDMARSLMVLAVSIVLGLVPLGVTLLVGSEPVDGRALAAVVVGSVTLAAGAALLAVLIDRRSGGAR